MSGAFSKQLRGCGAFPNFWRARVVRTGVEHDMIDFSAMQDVAAMTLVESTLAPVGARYRRLGAATLGGR